MNRHHPRAILFVLSLLAACAGRGWAEESSPRPQTALPPKEAAKACLATADEMVHSGYRQEAIALYERARQLDPTQKQVCRVLAVLYDDVGADTKALTEYNQALQLTPKDADLFNDLGYFYFHRSDLANAEKWLRKAIAQSPKNERAWVNLAMTLGQQGRYQDSFEAFCKVLSPAAAHSNVGMIMARDGHRDEATRAFQQAVALDPTLKQSRAMLAYFENPQDVAQRPNSAQRPVVDQTTQH